MFLKRLGSDPHANGAKSAGGEGCPDIWELDNGDFAIIGTDITAVAIAKLPPDLRECVILRDIEELSYQEIVDILEIPLGTVKSRINRGRIELAKTLRRMKIVEYI